MLTHMKSVVRHIEIKWSIIGYNNYGFGVDKKLYNLKTGRELKQSMNCCSIGYWFGKKFLTLKSIKPLLYRKKKIFCPF